MAHHADTDTATACTLEYPTCTGAGALVEDPYAAEVHGESRLVVACSPCLAELANDV